MQTLTQRIAIAIFMLWAAGWAKGSTQKSAFDTTYLEIRRDTALNPPLKFVFDTSYVVKTKEVTKVASILNGIWEEDICGSISDTLDIMLVVTNYPKMKSSRVTNIDMYNEKENIPSLLHLGSIIRKQLKRNCVLVIMYTGKPSCD
ncbi:MAG TPA: hypothetical protein PKO15_11580 [Fibrobacteria bacterium]|nr:hypothetical protein [Fibrobacteria bacterium]